MYGTWRGGTSARRRIGPENSLRDAGSIYLTPYKLYGASKRQAPQIKVCALLALVCIPKGGRPVQVLLSIFSIFSHNTSILTTFSIVYVYVWKKTPVERETTLYNGNVAPTPMLLAAPVLLAPSSSWYAVEAEIFVSAS